jgi:hypothetical protein
MSSEAVALRGDSESTLTWVKKDKVKSVIISAVFLNSDLAFEIFMGKVCAAVQN